MSPSWAYSAVLVTALTLISCTDSIDGKTLKPSAPMPFRRTLVVRMPSTDTSFWYGRLPEIENCCPARCTSGMAWMARIGEVFCVRNVKGSVCNSRLSTSPPTRGFSVLMMGATLCTTTCSLRPPTARRASMRTVLRASTGNGSVTKGTKLWSSTLTRYCPCVRFRNS